MTAARRRSYHVRNAVVCAATLCAPVLPAVAAFQDSFASARTLAIGGAGLSIVADPESLALNPAGRAAVVALVAVLDIPLVNRSVEWWENRTLHQQSTLAELKIQDLTLFTLMLGFVVFGLVGAWLLLHRFRVGRSEEHTSELQSQA